VFNVEWACAGWERCETPPILCIGGWTSVWAPRTSQHGCEDASSGAVMRGNCGSRRRLGFFASRSRRLEDIHMRDDAGNPGCGISGDDGRPASTTVAAALAPGPFGRAFIHSGKFSDHETRLCQGR